MKVYRKIDQQSPEWLDLRKGKVTGSKLPKLISPITFKKSSGKVYNQEIGSIAIGEWVRDDGSGISTQAIEEGHMGESEARKEYQELCEDIYENIHKKKITPMEFNITQPAFLESNCGRYGFSPDGVVNDDGFIEIKTIFNQGKYLQAITNYADNLLIDDKYLIQVMMGFIVNPKFTYCDFIVYSMYMPSEFNLKVFRINRSDYAREIEIVKDILENDILPEIKVLREKFKKQFNVIEALRKKIKKIKIKKKL